MAGIRGLLHGVQEAAVGLEAGLGVVGIPLYFKDTLTDNQV